MPYLAIVTALALLEYMGIGFLVGSARGKYGIKAPATSGHPVFERTFRVHQNTLEQLIIFVPSLWLFGTYVSAVWGALIGLVFIVGRVVYVRGYVADPEKRGPGFGIGFLANLVLLVGGLIGALMVLLSASAA
ncbi:MAG: MAPEG family protein [Myxococcota bacterium]